MPSAFVVKRGISLSATGVSIDEFVSLISDNSSSTQAVPLIGFSEAGSGGYFDDGGFPVGKGWDEIAFPKVNDPSAFALEISGDGLLPLYRDGDTIIVSPGSQARRGDRVVVRTRAGDIMARVLIRQTARTIELNGFRPDLAPLSIGVGDVAWVARIVWASQ